MVTETYTPQYVVYRSLAKSARQSVLGHSLHRQTRKTRCIGCAWMP
jgi:hypothetical protein